VPKPVRAAAYVRAMVDWGEATQTVAALAAAAAAGASWLSVVQARRITEAAALPDLHAQAVQVISKVRPDHLMLSIHNAGGATAKAVGYILVGEDSYAWGYVEDGFLPAGQTVRIRTAIPVSAQTSGEGVVWCRDLRERTFVWDLKGNRKELGRRSGTEPRTIPDLLTPHYPDVKLETLTQVGAKVVSGDD